MSIPQCLKRKGDVTFQFMLQMLQINHCPNRSFSLMNSLLILLSPFSYFLDDIICCVMILTYYCSMFFLRNILSFTIILMYVKYQSIYSVSSCIIGEKIKCASVWNVLRLIRTGRVITCKDAFSTLFHLFFATNYQWYVCIRLKKAAAEQKIHAYQSSTVLIRPSPT